MHHFQTFTHDSDNEDQSWYDDDDDNGNNNNDDENDDNSKNNDDKVMTMMMNMFKFNTHRWIYHADTLAKKFEFVKTSSAKALAYLIIIIMMMMWI